MPAKGGGTFQWKVSPWKSLGSKTCVLPLWQEQPFGLLFLWAICWKTLPLNLMRKPFIKEPLLAAGAWSLLAQPSWPFPGGNMALFSQTKHGLSREGAQTHCLVCTNISTWLEGSTWWCFLSLANACIFTSPSGKTALLSYGNLSLTRNFSSRLKSATITKEPNPSEFQGWGGSSQGKNCDFF